MRSVTRTPDVAGVNAVGVGGHIAQPLEGVPAVAQVLRAVGEGLQLVRLHLGAVLGLLEVLHLGRDAVDGAVEAGDL